MSNISTHHIHEPANNPDSIKKTGVFDIVKLIHTSEKR